MSLWEEEEEDNDDDEEEAGDDNDDDEEEEWGDNEDDDDEEEEDAQRGMRGVHCGDLMRPPGENIPSDSDPSKGRRLCQEVISRYAKYQKGGLKICNLGVIPRYVYQKRPNRGPD